MPVVIGGFLHYTDMKKFLKNLLLRKRWSDFEIVSQEWCLGDLFQKLFDPSINIALVNAGCVHSTEILKKSFSPKLLIRF